MIKSVFIINGTLRKIESIINELKTLFIDYNTEFYITEKPNHATALSKQAILQNCDYLIAVGGDGTINEVVNGYMQCDAEKRKNVRVGLLPRGTGNDFARFVKIKKTSEYLLYLIKNNIYSAIDIGEANFVSFSGMEDSRFYINITDIGIGGLTVKYVNESNKFLGSDLTFIFSAIKAFFNLKPQEVKLSSSDFSWEGAVISLCIANGKYFGSGIGIAPNAIANDGYFDLTIVGNLNVLHFLRYLPSLKKSKIINHAKITYRRVTSCKIDSYGQKFPVDMDGEYIGHTPVQVKIHPSAMNFLKE
jgi:diacylglycerol kinase (ATP)